MKRIIKVLLALGVAGSFLWSPNARADVGISAGVQINAGVRVGAVADFDAPLAADGAWITLASYGRCWHPRGVAVSWRPYCEGQWVLTDEGWYWQSDEPWAWACYHYGAWSYDAGYGWCWVPGTEWAPAWVNWRSGGGYIGWAPCAPGGVAVDVGFFAFVPTTRFAEPIGLRSVVVNNRDIGLRTVVLSGTSRESINVGGSSRNVVVNRGPAVADIQKASGREIRPVAMRDAESRTHVPPEVMRRNANTAPRNEGQQRPPSQELAPRNTAPTRGVNPQPPEVAPREVPNRETGPREVPNRETTPRETPNTPAPNREVPNRQNNPREVPNTQAPARENPVPNRTVPERSTPAPSREVPNREQPAPRETAPPKTEREPRSDSVAPSRPAPAATEKAAPGRVPVTAQPAHPSEPSRPAEQPRQSEPKKDEKNP